jgi:hypothetical protein
MNGEVSFYQNKFNGNEYSCWFQMLKETQTGQNMWLARSKEHL